MLGIIQFSFNRTVAVDMRGYGDSDKPSAVKAYHSSKIVGDIEQLIEALGNTSFNCYLLKKVWFHRVLNICNIAFFFKGEHHAF